MMRIGDIRQLTETRDWWVRARTLFEKSSQTGILYNAKRNLQRIILHINFTILVICDRYAVPFYQRYLLLRMFQGPKKLVQQC
jgi:hypothetical protein